MAYNNAIPNATDRISDSQQPLKDNFASISTLVGINHVQFDDASGDQGKHKWLAMPVQAPAPTGSFLAGEVGMYSFLDTITTKNELYLNITHQATVRQIPSTSSSLSIVSSPGNNTEGWSYLPSGHLIRWGPVSGNSLVTTTFATGVGVAPAFNELYSVQITPVWGTTSDVDFAVRLVDFTTAQFRWYVSKRTTTGAETTNRNINFLAIGR